MQPKLEFQLTSGELALIKMNIERFLYKKVYAFVYANSPHGSPSSPKYDAVLAHMQQNHSSLLKLVNYFKITNAGTVLTTLKTVYAEDMIQGIAERCIDNMRWKEEHPPPPVRRARADLPVETEEEDIAF